MRTADRLFLCGLTLFALAILAAIVVKHLLGYGPSSVGLARWILAGVCIVLGIVVIGINVGLACRQVWLQCFPHHGPTWGEESLVPIVGSAFIAIATVLFPSHFGLGIGLAILYLADPGGLARIAWVSLRLTRDPRSWN